MVKCVIQEMGGESMYPDLSLRQTNILEFIKDEIRKKGYPPAVREIGDAVGFELYGPWPSSDVRE